MRIAKGSRWILIGDSITDCGRVRPGGEGKTWAAMGSGYVAIVDALLTAVYPELGLRITNMGCGGNTVREMKDRWQSDVIELKPDWLSIMIGINDVWRQYDKSNIKDLHVSPQEYESTLSQLIEQTRPMLKGLVLLTPYFVEPNRQDPMRAMMDKYGAIVKKLAEKYGAILVDTQAAFDQVLKHVHPMFIAGDRVHPHPSGHAIIARALLKALDFQW